MIQRLKRLFLERIVLPMAFEAFAKDPKRLEEYLANNPEAQEAQVRVALSTRGIAQGLLARIQTLLGHGAGNPALQESVGKAISSLLVDDAGSFAALSSNLGKGLATERRLAQAFLRESGPLLFHASGNPELEGVVAAEVARLATASVGFRNLARAALHQQPEWQTGVLGDREVFHRLLRRQGKGDWARLEAWVFWHQLITALQPWLREDAAQAALEGEGVRGVNNPNELRKAFYQSLCTDGSLPLKLGSYRLPDDHSFWPQLFEIFVNEDYAFTAASDAPRIIDAGMHMGLATYYFKSCCPKATIIAFEPSPELREVAAENIRRCGFEGVTIEPYALFKRDEALRFHIDSEDTMAGSLLASHHAQDAHQGDVEVQARCLSAYLSEPVDYLKLDIEGAEGGVLEECRGVLRNVGHIFIEYHEGHDPEENSLPAILKILDETGFAYEVTKSHGYQKLTGNRPMLHVGKPYSAIIWAKNRAWPHAGTV